MGGWAYPGTAKFFWVPPIISGTGKATNFKFGQNNNRVHPNKIPLKFWRKGSVGVSRDCQIFLGTPYYLTNGKSYGFQIWPVYSKGTSKQMSIKNFREKGAWAYSGTDYFFGVPPIISGTGKATDFKFGQYIQRGITEQMPIKKFREQGAWPRGRIQGLPIFSGAPYYLRNG